MVPGRALAVHLLVENDARNSTYHDAGLGFRVTV